MVETRYIFPPHASLSLRSNSSHSANDSFISTLFSWLVGKPPTVVAGTTQSTAEADLLSTAPRVGYRMSQVGQRTELQPRITPFQGSRDTSHRSCQYRHHLKRPLCRPLPVHLPAFYKINLSRRPLVEGIRVIASITMTRTTETAGSFTNDGITHSPFKPGCCLRVRVCFPGHCRCMPRQRRPN